MKTPSIRLASYRVVTIITLSVLLLVMAACAPITPPSTDPTVQPAEEPTEEPTAAPPEEPTEVPIEEPQGADNDAIETAVRDFAARDLGVDPATVNIVASEAVEWSDSCLGAGGPAELCMQVITPGYRVVVNVDVAEMDGTEYIYHTDATGEQIRPARTNPTGTPRSGDAGPLDQGQQEVARAVRQVVMQEHGVDADAISVAAVEFTEWPDACLGVPDPDELCAQMITPGYRVVVEVTNEEGTVQEYIYHTDATGTSIRQAAGPEARRGAPRLLWS